MRILLVEDDDRIAKPLAEDLKHQQHIIDVATDGVAGWDYAQTIDYDLILLDLMLPRLDGISLCKQLRKGGFRGFVLMLTAKDTTTDKIIGLDAGADDYMVKPFEVDELAARIRALSRRPTQIQATVLQQGQLRLDLGTHAVSYAETALDLTPKEYLILEHLMQNPGQVFTRAMILDKLWECDRDSGEGTIRTHVNNLRQKLKTVDSSHQFIETVYGVGYRLNSPGK